jgi:hypothetical protein
LESRVSVKVELKLGFSFHVPYFGALQLSNQAEPAQSPIDNLVDLISLYNFANYGSHQSGLD